jgi:hypothetical protein
MKKGVDFTLPRGQTNEEKADLGVEDVDREEEEADLGVEDTDRDEEEADLRHGVPAAAGAGTPPRTSGLERKKPLGRHSRHAPALTAGFSRARWKRKQEEEEEKQWGVVTLIKGDGRHGAKEVSPSRPSSIAREGAFTFPPEPARATPPPPKIGRTRRHELGCKETRVSGVSPEPGGEASFGSREPGQLAGQRHKHGGL